MYTARQIAGIKRACIAGREVLDLAAAVCKPGVTTDEIDRVVSVGGMSDEIDRVVSVGG